MRTKENTYESTIARAEEILASLDKNGCLVPQAKVAWIEYRKFADPVRGEPQPNIPWNEYANPRAGYRFDIPGLVTEIITLGCVTDLTNAITACLAQDKDTQVNQKIDILVEGSLDIKSLQCKTIRFNGQRLTLHSGFFAGVATHLSLIDIDDRVCYIFEREKLAKFSAENKHYVYIWDLDALAVKKINLKTLY